VDASPGFVGTGKNLYQRYFQNSPTAHWIPERKSEKLQKEEFVSSCFLSKIKT
jgi:hypothetical protein